MKACSWTVYAASFLPSVWLARFMGSPRAHGVASTVGPGGKYAFPHPRLRGGAWSLSGLALLWLTVAAIAADPTADPAPAPATKPVRTPDVVYVPTPQTVVDFILEQAEIKRGDLVYDLGCGDGRIVVTAAKKYGVKAIGFDIDPQRVKEARENVRTNGVDHLVTIKQTDIFTLDLREASVVTLYLLPDLNVKLMPQLARLKPGSRILSHEFDMRGAKPASIHRIEGERDFPGEELDEEPHTIYKWIVPWEKEVIVTP